MRRPPDRRWRRLLVTLSSLLLLTGCGTGLLGDPEDPPALLPAGQRVFLFSVGSNGWTSPFIDVMSGLDLVVYGDGRVFELANNQSAGLPPAYELARVDPLAVARFARDAEKQNLVNDTTDFGDAAVTDQGSATVALHGPSNRTSVNVYAFEKRFEDGLTRTQRRNRAELRTMIASAYALVDDAQRSAYLPERVRVLEFEYLQGGKPPGAVWPGPDLARILKPETYPRSVLACAVLTGPDAERAYAAARNNPDGIWSVAGRPRVLAVVPTLSGLPDCQG